MTFAEYPSGGVRQRIGKDLLSETGLELLNAFLTYNPVKRITADGALEHAYFKVSNVCGHHRSSIQTWSTIKYSSLPKPHLTQYIRPVLITLKSTTFEQEIIILLSFKIKQFHLLPFNITVHILAFLSSDFQNFSFQLLLNALF